MSFSQSRSDRNDSAHYRKSGRSAGYNHPRTSSAAYGEGGGPAPAPSLPSAVAANQSSKKPGNAQGVQPQVNFPSASHHSDSKSVPSAQLRDVLNGASAQSQTRGSSDVPGTSTMSKPAETAAAPSIGALPKAPTSQSTTMNSDTGASTTPVKAPGEASKGFAFQFGSISPGFVNGMQIPARTSSAPPNIDEQKRDQARHDPVKAVPPVPIPPAARKQLPKKDLGSLDHSSAADINSTPKAKKDSRGQPVTPPTQSQKAPLHPRMSLPMTYNQQQVPVKFSVPNPQIQSQGMPPTPIQMQMHIPIPLPMANASPQLQQQMFVQGIQPHQLPPQGTLHHGQGMGFPQLPLQLGNLGMGIGQYNQQQGGQLGGVPRKTPVKITHPDTHQEVRLDRPSDVFSDAGPSRSLSNVPQSQPTVSYPPHHQFNYYHNYNPATVFYPGAGSLPVTGAQIAPAAQAPRYNYPINQAPQNASLLNPQGNNLLASSRTGVLNQGIAEPARQEHAQNLHDGTSSTSFVTQEAVKQVDSSLDKNAAVVSLSRRATAAVRIDQPKVSGPSGESYQQESEFVPGSSPKPGIVRGQSSDLLPATFEHNLAEASASCESAESSISFTDYPPNEVSASTVIDTEGGRSENSITSTSTKDRAKNQGKTGDGQLQPQVEDHTTPTSRFPSHALLTTSGANEGAGTLENNLPASGTSEGGLGSRSESRTDADAASSALSRSKQKSETMGNEGASFSSEISDAAITIKNADPCSQPDDGLDDETTIGEDKVCAELVVGAKGCSGNSGHGSESFSSKSSELKVGKEEFICHVETSVDDIPDQHDGRVDGSAISTFPTVYGMAAESVPCTAILSADSHGNDVSISCASETGGGSIVCKELADSTDNPIPELHEKATTESDAKEKSVAKGGSMQTISSNHKPTLELNSSKSVTSARRRRRESLRKADAAGSTSDLFMAYKDPEEKKETITSSKTASPRTSSKLELADTCPNTALPSEGGDESKAEPDDWEDAADVSTPKLESTTNAKPGDHQECYSCIANKYSRDFLLKFIDQYTSLPDDFEVTSDIAEAFTFGMNISRSVGRDHHPSPGRQTVRPRLDRRGSGTRDDDRWTKIRGASSSGQDLHLDAGFGSSLGFRPWQGANYGVLSNPRAQSPIQYVGGIVPGLMQAPASQGGTQRASSDADRWQHATSFQQKGLIPSPQTPLQMMHKAEKKYEVGKAADEEEAKQRQLKAILNKLTPQNFEKLFQQVIAVRIDNAITLKGLISQIFDKALMEPTFCEMYANLCSQLSQALPDFNEGDDKITFKRLLLNKCQEEFERGEREQEEANKVEEEGEVKQSKEQREEKRIKARRRMLGNIRLIGELYKKRMLTEKIMHECIKKLLGQYETPDEEDLEALCKLMSTIGEMIDHPKAKVHMDAYFERMKMLSNSMTLSSRVRFMLKDAIDLRKNKWQQRRKVEGPKKIEEVHRDAAQERHSQAGRVARSPGINPSGRRGQQMEFAPRGNPLSSPNVQTSSFRGLPSQARSRGAQDVRFEERQTFEPRTLSVPVSQKSMGDDAITLGPQGGLGRGLSFRGSSSILGTSLSDHSSSAVDSHRNPVGLNGFSSMDRTNSYSSRDNSTMRSAADLDMGPATSDQINVQGGGDVRSQRYGFDRPATAPLSSQGSGVALTQNTASQKVWPEERLQDMSIAAIREYYSAKDEKEVALCIKDLDCPGFYPSMVSLWVMDSFERKDMDRDLLAKLLVNLSRPHGGMLSQGQLIEGFESVLTTLEDAVTDAPKAPEFLGRIFGKVIAENVTPLSEIGRILYEGGEEQGQLLEAGLAADVLGNALDAIRSDKGEAALNEIRRRSNLRLEDFRPPGSLTSTMLEKFISSPAGES